MWMKNSVNPDQLIVLFLGVVIFHAIFKLHSPRQDEFLYISSQNMCFRYSFKISHNHKLSN